MLIYSAEIERKSAGFGACFEATVVVEAFLIGAAVVVDDGLAEVEAVAERRSADAAQVCIDAIELRMCGVFAAYSLFVGFELLAQRKEDLEGLLVIGVGIDLVARLLQHVHDTEAGPRPQVEVGGIDITQRVEAVER